MTNIHINLNKQLQEFEGWGTALCWWAHVVGQWKDENKIDEICDLIFDETKGLGLNIVRYNFGAGDNPPNIKNLRVGANIPSYGIKRDVWDMEADDGQRKILLKSIERGVDIKEGFYNSPPLWMTDSGSSAGAEYGQNNLRHECYDEFAKYTVSLLKKLDEVHSIRFDTLSPFNEPSSTWWISDNDQEGCHYSVESQNKIITLLHKAAKEYNLYDLELSGPEGWSTHETVGMYLDYDDQAKELIDQINTHTYWADDRTRMLLNKIAKKDNKKLWMSEVCLASNNEHDHSEVSTGLMIAANIIKDIKLLKPNAWVYWQAIEDEALNHNYGFIHAYFQGKEEFFITKSYYFMAQFTKYIRPGSRFIEVNDEHLICSYNEKDCCVTLVIVNNDDDDKSYTINIENFNHYKIIRTSATESLGLIDNQPLINNTCMINSPKQSVTTVVMYSIE